MPTHKQCAAVTIHQSPLALWTSEPPQNCVVTKPGDCSKMAAVHGHEFGLAGEPPTMRVNCCWPVILPSVITISCGYLGEPTPQA